MGIIIANSRRRLFEARLARIRCWASRRLGGTRHERRVLQIAMALFKLTSEFHGLDARHRRLLKLAALLHDVGRYHGADKHHIHGARMVLKSRTLALKEPERRIVAHLTRYHRRRVPNFRREWRHTDIEHPRTMQLLLAILRAADTLDSRKFVTPALAMRLKGRELRIRCYVHDVREARQAFDRRKKYRLLEQMLKMQINVQLRPADSSSIEI